MSPNHLPVKPLLPLLLAAIALLAATAPFQSSGAQATADDSQNMLRRTITHDGIEREYFVHLPESGGENLPVVIGIHGYTSTATGFAASNGLNRHADEHGYIAVYPQGTHFAVDSEQGQSFRITSWNDLAANLGPRDSGPHCTPDSVKYPCPPECGECNRCAWTSCHDDLGFIEQLLDAVQAEFDTDTSRYYLLGVSNGAMMTLRVGCSLSDRFAAIAPIIGQLAPGYECGPKTDLPMLHLFGAEDNTVRFDGKPGGDGFKYVSAAQTAAVWADAMACSNGPHDWQNEISQDANLVCTAYSDCRQEGHEVVSCMDPDGDHNWPEQAAVGMPATCVTAEQYDSMPDQARCGENSGDYVHLGMDLIWQFFSGYSNDR